MIRVVSLLLGVLVSALGCSATGPQFAPIVEPLGGQALLYVYRPDRQVLYGRTAEIQVNKAHATSLKNNGYTVFKLDPGTYEITQRWEYSFGDSGDFQKPTRARVTLLPDTRTYVRLVSTLTERVTPTGVRDLFQWQLREVQPGEALSEISLTRRVDPDGGQVK